MPMVHAFGRFDPAIKLPVVGIDNESCGALAADTLVARGYQAIAMLGGPAYASSTQDRVAGFMAGMARHAHTIVDVSYADAYSYDAGHRAMTMLLHRKHVDAVFCGDDLICMGAMDAARDQGLSIPNDIGFLGFNDMTMARWRAYDLTTIRQPVNDIILQSIETVVALSEGRWAGPSVQLLPCALIERGSLRLV